MEQKPASVWKSSLLSGVYLGIALILLSVVFYVTGNTFSKTAQYLGYPVMILVLFWPRLHIKRLWVER